MRTELVIPLTIVAVLLCLSPAECAEAPSAPEPVTVSGHGQTVFALHSPDRLHLALYAQGQLSSELSVTQLAGGGWRIAGRISHTPPHGDAQQHALQYSSRNPDEVSLNGRTIPIPPPPAESEHADGALRGPWFVLTLYGRAVPTGRYFPLANAEDLDRKTTYSHAWYFQRDLHIAEVYRDTLEMDDLDGWVLAWDQQHCMQHSDNARAAKLRVFADGRVVVNRGHTRPVVEVRIAKAEVERLVASVLKLDGVRAHDPLGAQSSRVFPMPLGSGLWDQYQDLIEVRQGELRHSLRVVHPGRDDRIGNVPAGWDAVADVLWGLLHPQQTAELR